MNSSPSRTALSCEDLSRVQTTFLALPHSRALYFELVKLSVTSFLGRKSYRGMLLQYKDEQKSNYLNDISILLRFEPRLNDDFGSYWN